MQTPYQKKKAERDKAVYDYYIFLTVGKAIAPTVAERMVMARHKIHARSTIWAIVKRVNQQQESCK